MPSSNHLLFILMAAAVVVLNAEYDDDFCTRYLDMYPASSDQNGMQPSFSNNFYVFIEIKNRTGQAISYTEEYYSVDANQANFIWANQLNQSQIWVDATTDEILSGPTTTSICTDQKLNGSLLGLSLGVSIDAKGNVSLKTPGDAFGWNRKEMMKTPKYLGGSSYRNIPTFVWMTCSYKPETDITAVTTWHIVDPFKFPLPIVISNSTQKPVLPIYATVEALNKTDPYHITETSLSADFSGYRTIQADDPIFQIPTTMLCSSKPSQQIPLPPAPNYFRFRGEQITLVNPASPPPNQAEVAFTVETYMQQLKIFVQDYVTSPYGATINDKAYLRTVNDYSSGVSFAIDLEAGSCQISPIPQGVDSIQIANNMISMRTTQQFFDLDSNQYQYMGQHTMRGIMCDAWSAYFTDSQSDHLQNTLYTWYFASASWMTNNGFNVSMTLPVTLEMQTQLSYIQFNFYEYETQDKLEIPDLSYCFAPTSTLNVEIYLAANFSKLTTVGLVNVRQSVMVTLRLVTSLKTYLRVSPIDLQPAANTETVIRFKLFDYTALPPGNVANATDRIPNSQIYSELVSAVDRGLFTLDVFYTADTGPANASFTARPHSLGLNSAGKFLPGSPKSSGSKYSSGAMAGLAFGTLALGLLLGAGAIFGVKRLKLSLGERASDLKPLDKDPETES